MIVALSIFLITIGSIAFHFWSPWWWTEVASNWGNMDDTILLTFWITGAVFVAICFFVAYCVWKFSYKKERRAEYKPEDKKLEADMLLVSVGRSPVTDGLNAQAAGVLVNEQGFIEVSAEYFRNYTIPMRMAVLLHEFSHYWLNQEQEGLRFLV